MESLYIQTIIYPPQLICKHSFSSIIYLPIPIDVSMQTCPRKGKDHLTHTASSAKDVFVNKINRKVPFVGKFYHNSKKYVCGGLNSHLTSNCFKKCGDYYQTHGLLGFEQSLIQYLVQPNTSKRNHSASEIGVTP